MATLSRHPLASRILPMQSPSTQSTKTSRSGSITKRPRSPDPILDSRSKRVKAAFQPAVAPTAVPVPDDDRLLEKDERRAQREAQKEEFRSKYRRAFPTWVFYFDADVPAASADSLGIEIEGLGARVEDFFSAEVTHLITNAPLPSDAENKENLSKLRSSQSRAAALLKSPIKLKSRPPEDSSQNGVNIVMKKALEFGIKIWSVPKLESVLERCISPAERAASQSHVQPIPANQPTLTNLLAAERKYGTTSERDPTQKRHDYRYFNKSSYFVLVEDMHQELATVIAMEYGINKSRDGIERASWPVLHCHPQARGPFVEFDELEKKRWEKQERAQKKREIEREQERERLRELEQRRRSVAQQRAKQHGDLRRTVSMVNLHRHASGPDSVFQAPIPDVDADESAHASGYLASNTYIAASGNSVGITSTIGTTSTVGRSLHNLQLPASLRDKMQQHVVTARKLAPASGEGGSHATEIMGPPANIPERRVGMLKKSRSTNTLRLPKREEGSKPGYCESCRQKFEDFQRHVHSSRHRKFASDDANFAQLDSVLSRVRRRTREEVAAQRSSWEEGLLSERTDDEDEEVRMAVLPDGGRTDAPLVGGCIR